MRKTEKDTIDTKKAEQTKAAGDSAGESKGEPNNPSDKEEPQESDEPGDPDVNTDDAGQDADPQKEETTAEEEPTPADPPVQDAEKENLKAELLEARSQLAAYAAGVAPEMVADAVTLATAEAKASGEVTEEAVVKAMENVLKRHPEWKTKAASGAKKTSGGFKLGADPDSAGRSKDSPADKGGSKKPWNKFNR